jgi:hypothetical protein
MTSCKKILLLFLFTSAAYSGNCFQKDSLIQFNMYADVKITLDIPANFYHHNSSAKETMIIFYALPNGNTTEQTMGKKPEQGIDWHFNIQNIKAQTDFIRSELKSKNIIVVYLENNFRSWPLWKSKHANYVSEVQHIVDTVYRKFANAKTTICLNGHSGGGRFIFSFLDGVKNIPAYITRIAFLDSDYGYEKDYGNQIRQWLKANKHAALQVFAYEDSLVEFNGKRIVSDTGGTWYRSHLMLRDLSEFYKFKITENDSLVIYKSLNDQIGFYLKPNPDKKILHTTQVELNGFIHSILAGTKRESVNYKYYGKRAYENFIK